MTAKTHSRPAAPSPGHLATGRALSGSGPTRRPDTGITLSATGGTIGSLSNPVPVQVKTSRGTVDGVIMKADNYEALREYIEDLEARRTFENTRDQESFPLEIADRLIDGENPIRVFRKYRGMTLDALARAAMLSKGYLSEIETGKKPGSVKALRRIADALGVDVDNLL